MTDQQQPFGGAPTPPPMPGAVPPPPPGAAPAAQPGAAAGLAHPAAAPGVGTQVPQQKSFNWRMLALPVIGCFVLFGWWSNRGTTSAESLEAGDCFVMTDAVEIERLETPDCSEPHDSQIMGVIEVPSATPYPADDAMYWETVYNRCFDRVDASLIRFEELPADTIVDIFTPTEIGWNMGDRESLCIIHSASGLEGSFMGTP